MISDEDHVLGTTKNGNQCFRLSGLCSFINQHLRESEILKSPVECCNTSCTYDFGILEYLIFGLSLQILELLILLFREVTELFLLCQQVLHRFEGPMIEVLDLLVQREVVNIGAD